MGDKHTKGFSANFPALVANFIPCPVVHLIWTIAQLTGKSYNFSYNQFGNTPRIAERRVEDRNAMFGCVLEVNLVCSNTETTDDNEVSGFLQDASTQLRLGADSNHMYISIRGRK